MSALPQRSDVDLLGNGERVSVTIHAGTMPCGRERCRQRTRAVARIDVAFGPNTCSFSLSDLDGYGLRSRNVGAHLCAWSTFTARGRQWN